MKHGILFVLFFLFADNIAVAYQIVATFDAPASTICGLGYGRDILWGVDKNTEKLYAIDPADGSVIYSWQGADNGTQVPTGLAVVNNTIYVACAGGSSAMYPDCYKYSALTGKYEGTFELDC